MDYGDCCPDFLANCTGPQLLSISPNEGPTQGGGTLTITGKYIDKPGASVKVGGKNCPLLDDPNRPLAARSCDTLALAAGGASLQLQTLRCTLPEGAGIDQAVVVTVNSVASNPVLFDYFRPSLSALTPSSSLSTQGGESILLTGNNLGTLQTGKLYVDGVLIPPDPNHITAYSHTSITFKAPPGQGVGISVVVDTEQQLSNPLFYSHGLPQIAMMAPSGGPTVGGQTVTLTGQNFGLSGTVRFNGQTIAGGNIVSYGHQQIQFVTPAGQGKTLPVSVRVDNQDSNQLAYSYTAPSIDTVSSGSFPTAGGSVLNIQGSNFGTSGIVKFNVTQDCELQSYTQTQILCELPPGQGLDRTVQVIASEQPSNLATVDYDSPGITTFDPNSAMPGATLTVQGTNFGQSGTVTIGGSHCPNTTYTDTQIQCQVPSGQGSGHLVQVDVSTQIGNAGKTFTFVPPPTPLPVISSISPTSGPTAGGTILAISGTDFGASGTVTVGGLPCPTGTPGFYTATLINCTIPPGMGRNQTVVVQTGASVSNAKLYSYNAPVIFNVSPNSAPTSGNVELTLSGQSFGTNGLVKIGETICPTLPGQHSPGTVKCTVPVGEGTGKTIRIEVGGQTGESVNAFSYNPPDITSADPNTTLTTGGVSLTLMGTSFGLTPRVTVGGASCPVLGAQSNHTKVVCTIPAGQGRNVPILMDVAGQVDTFLGFGYAAPQIQSIDPNHAPTAGGTVLTLQGTGFGLSGKVTIDGAPCDPNGIYTHTQIQCTVGPGQGIDKQVALISGNGNVTTAQLFSYDPPQVLNVMPTTGPTNGGTTLTITGSNFGLSPAVTVGGQHCPQPVLSSHTQITCVTPSGEGLNKIVEVSVLSRSVQSPVGFSYLGPQVTNLSFQAPPTTGQLTMVIAGSNLGTTATVTVGGDDCPVALAEHDRILCEIPPGQGVDRPVLVDVADQPAQSPEPLDYAAPVIESVSPASGPEAGGTVLTILGRNFGLSGSVDIGTGSCNLVSGQYSHGRIQCMTPPGSGSQELKVTVASQSASTQFQFEAEPTPTATQTPVPTATQTPVPTATQTPVLVSTATPTPTAATLSGLPPGLWSLLTDVLLLGAGLSALLLSRAPRKRRASDRYFL